MIKKVLKIFGLLTLTLFLSQLFRGDSVAYAISPEIVQQIEFISTLNSVASYILWPILVLIGGLMDNSLLFGSGMEARLREIWIPIRNLVNLAFVVGLVGIAIYNMTGFSEDNMGIKTLLPKIIIGIIAINFSFVGIKVFLDFINVSTSAVFALPDQVLEGMSALEITKDPQAENAFCKSFSGATGKLTEADITQKQMEIAKQYAIIELKLEAKDPCTTVPCTDKQTEYMNKNLCEGFKIRDKHKKFFEQFGGQNVALAMAIQLGSVQYYQDVGPISVDTVEKMTISLIISLIMYLLYVITFVMLFLVLLGRLIVLWVVIAISPILILVFAVPALGSKIPAINDVKDKFIQNAIAPVIIALSMTIGWIMLNAMKSVEFVSSSETIHSSIVGTQGLPVVGLTTLQDIIVGIGVIVVTWTGIKTAMSKTIASAITNSIYGGLEGLGKKAASLPFSTGIFPSKGGAMSPLDVLTTFRESANSPIRGTNFLGSDKGQALMIYFSKLTDPKQKLALLRDTTSDFNAVHAELVKMNTIEFDKLKNAADNRTQAALVAMRTAPASDANLKALQKAIKDNESGLPTHTQQTPFYQ